MSRIGKRPIEIPSGVTVTIEPARVGVAGPLGTLTQQVPQRMKIEQAEGQIVVTRPTERGEDRALHGLTRTLVANMVEGVTKGFEKKLEIQGVGYRAALRGTDLELSVGYSHTVTIAPRPGISFEVPVPTQIVVKGTDKQQVGQTAAEIRKVRPPEPYKGKGIRYEGEFVRRKVGKRASQVLDASERPARGATAASAARCPARPSGRGSSSSARTGGSRRSSWTTRWGAPSPRRRGSRSRSRSRARRASRRPRSASSLPPPRRRRESRPAYSTGPATSTTVASRRSLTAHARED